MFGKPPKVSPAPEGVRILPPIAGYLTSGESLVESLRRLSGAEVFHDLAQDLEFWPPNSHISNIERVVLHWLICETRAEAVLEIGSFFAGTTLFLSTSTLGAGFGRVHTIDPYGQYRVPYILQTWPAALQAMTTYWPKYACDFFVPNAHLPHFDVILIDGDHGYPSVLHDVFASYANTKYGGFLVVDNAEQHQVLDGCRDFLTLNPGVEAARLAITGTGPDGRYVFRIDDTLDRIDATSAFVIIRKPMQIFLNHNVLGFQLNDFAGRKVEEVQITVRNETSRPIEMGGKVHLRALARDANLSPKAYDLGQDFTETVPPGKTTVRLATPKLDLPSDSSELRRFVEMDLFTRTPGDQMLIDHVKVDGLEIKPGRNFYSR